jgi:transposase
LPAGAGVDQGVTGGVGQVIADAGCDAGHLRTVIAHDPGATAQIKQNPSRSGPKAIDRALCREHNLVARFFHQITRFRRIALRCDKTITSLTGFVALACAMAWLA